VWICIGFNADQDLGPVFFILISREPNCSSSWLFHFVKIWSRALERVKVRSHEISNNNPIAGQNPTVLN
jgi:hypothetical protein